LVPDAIIPCEPHLFGTAANNGQMVAETDPKSPVVESFNTIARIVTGRAEVKRTKRGGLAPFLSRLRGKSA
ncbi:MAG: CtpF protein, partial [Bauldia litoralis]